MSCDGSEREDVVAINKRGQVRPVKYNSKYKKVRAESGCNEGSSSGKPTAYQEAEEVIAPDKDDKAQECQSHGHRENEDIYMLHMDESDDVTDNDTEFINFLKEKNETSLDDLIKVLETDNRWTAESDIDDDFIDEDEEHEEIDGNTNEDEPIQADTVREIGPLWSTSCFAFESANGDLLKLFHGTQFIDVQIINAVHVFQMLPSLSTIVPSTSRAHDLICSLLKKRNVDHLAFQLCGKGYEKSLCEQDLGMLLGVFKVPGCRFLFHSRANLRGIMYHSLDYTRTTSRNSYTVKFKNKRGFVEYGQVCWFVRCEDTYLHLYAFQY